VVRPFDALAAASACAWAYLAVAHGQFWRIRPLLLPRRPNPGNRRVIAVIPARDEAESIEATVRSLANQVERVIVVDDNSTDNTAALARNAGAFVVSGAPLRPGWTGKLWALHQGVAEALQEAPDFLLFTDADIVHTGIFGTTVERHLQTGNWEGLQGELVRQKAVVVKYHLMFIESKAKRIFGLWAKFIAKRKKRTAWLVAFKYYLLIALFIAAPVILTVDAIFFKPFLAGRIKKTKTILLRR